MKSTRKYLFFTGIILLLSFPACELTDDPMDEDPRDLFTGEWNCQEYLDGQPQMSYTVSIQSDPSDSTHIILKNFAFIGYDEKPPYGLVDGEQVIIPMQKVCYDESITLWGNGQSVSKNEIQWDYSVEVGGDSFDYTATFQRIR